MGFLSDIKGKTNTSDMRARFEELKNREQSGNLDEKTKTELKNLRRHFIINDI